MQDRLGRGTWASICGLHYDDSVISLVDHLAPSLIDEYKPPIIHIRPRVSISSKSHYYVRCIILYMLHNI
ncbi:hypothetical protein ACJIZ3_012940 [Penstemon smallii]|uniref:Uncharacterized protein n=1 Tax=Penstemon smallii TaxID=265156 RepID=A0ABD3USJ1_9LAMI